MNRYRTPEREKSMDVKNVTADSGKALINDVLRYL